MAGETTSGSLTSALPTIVADARIIKEFEGVYRRTCDIKRQKSGTGLTWTEFALNQLTGQDITETTDNRNYQTLSGTLLSIEPTMSQIIIKITDRTYRKIAAVVTGKFGGLAGNAMARKQDEDYLALFSGFATGCSPGTGNPLSYGHIASAENRIVSNVTEPSNAQVFTVLHGFQMFDIEIELRAGIGTYTLQGGMTEEVFKRGFKGTIANSNVFVDGNITVDATPDANGATHSREGVICVESVDLKRETDRDMYYGGGADVISLTTEYAFQERQSGTTQVWAWRHFSDATAPTSG